MNDLECELRSALTFYASFDEHVRGDFGGRVLTPSTRRDDPERPGEFVFAEGIDDSIFRIAKDEGVRGGALEVVNARPHRGRIFFPARDNLAYKPDGWSQGRTAWRK